MKTCSHCHVEKPESEFYTAKRRSRDGLHSWCKDCVKAIPPSRNEALSTKIVRNILNLNGIPCRTGHECGMPSVDLVALNCVPIEAKLSRISRVNYFHWTFTKGQAMKLKGFVVCVADFGNEQRVFVVPANELRRERGAFCLTVGSEHGNAKWDYYRQFENRFDLILQAAM